MYDGTPDICDAFLDNDCDGVADPLEDDGDGDGASECGNDCDDTDPELHVLDLDGDGDTTCDGDCDDDDADLNLADLDADGRDTCAGDCDDSDAAYVQFCYTCTRAVDGNAAGLADGLTWEDAFTDLQYGSPCIDAANGDVATPAALDGMPRYDDPDTSNTGTGTPDYADMGAFEYQP